MFVTKFMLPWSFSEEAASEKYMSQLQHNMWVTKVKVGVIITGGGKWVEITIPVDSMRPAAGQTRSGEKVLNSP